MENYDKSYDVWWIENESESFYGLREGYHEGALELIGVVEKTESLKTKDTLIFPILFLHTHSLEMALKECLKKLRTQKKKKNHNLIELCEELIQNLEKFCKDRGIEEQIENKEQLELFFERIKKYANGSMAGRYLFDLKGNEIYTEILGKKSDYSDLKKEIKEDYDFIDSILLFIEDNI